MRLIEVSTEVFAQIWAFRESGEETENAILERLLGFALSPITPENDKSEKVELFGKIRWVDDVVASLKELGGQAALADIYDLVSKRRKAANRSITREYQATIRRTLEDHSSDSANHRSDDLFRLIGRGIWALR